MKRLALILLLFIIPLKAVYSQSPFIYRNLPTVATLPDMSNNIQFIDIDNDGDKDLVDYYDQRFRFYKSNGVAIDSLNPVELLAPNNHFSFTDWDQDGYIDIILTQVNGIVLIKNLGDFNFSPSVTLFSGNFIPNFSVSDINSDSYPDLIIYNGNIQLFINNNGSTVTENYSFAFPYQQVESSVTHVIYFEDVDNDGLKDMIFKSRQNKIYFYSQTGTYDYTLRDSIVSGDVGRLDHHPSIFLYDLNNDGKNEIITRNGGTFRVFNWSSGFNYTSVYSGNAAYAVAGGSSISTTIPLSDFYDVDRDGFLDIVAGNYVFFNNGNFTFNRVNINNPAVLYYPNYKCADINGNGKTDICYVYTIGNLISNTNDYEAFFRSENVTGRTIEPKQVVWHLWGYTHYDGDVVDFDNDGDMDVFGFNRGKSILWENINDTLYPKLLNGALPKDTDDVDFVDINHDGYEDLLYRASNQHRYRLNQSGNSLGGVNIITNSNMVLKLIDDIDDDGINELFYHLSNSSSHTVYMYKLDTGVPIFATSFSWNQSNHDNAVIRIGDYNLDGFKDIVIQIASTSMSGGYRLCIAKNDGQNNFSVVQNISSNNAVSLIGVIDVDGDSYPDIICHNGSNRIYGFKNNQGTISSSASTVGIGTSGFGSQAKGMLVDFDGDGLDDIVIQVDRGSQSLFRNNGHGFTLISTVPNLSKLVRIKDIDGDGDEDIICTNAWYENISIASFGIEGVVFYDRDADGIYNSSVDIAFPYFPVQLNSGWGTFYTDANGYFETPLSSVSGNYSFTIDPSVSSQFNATTLPYPSIISVDSLNPLGNLELGVLNVTNSIDGKLDITLSGNRCNESGRIFINYQNYSPETVDAEIKLVLAENSSFISSNHVPAQTTDTIIWQLNNLTPFKHGHFYADIQMPPTSSMGDTMHFQAQLILNGTLGADTITDNIQQILRCAYDPNDKNITMNDNVYFGDSIYSFVDETEYLIRFQNTGNDVARKVEIVDYLSNLFDWNSLRPVSASHSYNFSIDSIGKITVVFNDIDLPDSTTDFLGSMGYVKFQLRYKENSPRFRPINNYAKIYFDQNPPIFTNIHTFFRVDCKDFLNVSVINSLICSGSPLNARNNDYGLPFDYLWTINDQSDNTPAETSFSELNIGSHLLSLEISNYSCMADTAITVNVRPTPDVILNVGNTTTVCPWGYLDITSNYNLVDWYINGTYNRTASNLYSSYHTPTTIQAVYTENGCPDTATVEVYIREAPDMHTYAQTPFISSSIDVCPTDSFAIESNYGPIRWNVQFANGTESNYIHTNMRTYFPVRSDETSINVYSDLHYQGCQFSHSLTIYVKTINYTSTLNDNNIELSVNNGAQIQWLDCNNNYEPIAGANGNVFIPTEIGSYAAQIQLLGCTDTTECFILNTLAINSLNEQDMISYYPNPVKENLYINLHQPEETTEVFVRDVNGRLIANERFSNLTKLAIPFANLSNGIYIVTVKTSEYEKQIHVRKEF